MHERFAETLFRARQLAGMSREYAAEVLGISPRTLAYYESGRDVPDETVAEMVQAYGDPALGYRYLSGELETGKLILPPVPIAGVSSTALRLRVVMRRAADVEDALEAICYDDIITTEEAPTFDRCARLIKELEAACIGVTLMQEIGQNKKPREQGTTCCGTYHSGRKPK